MKAFLPSILCLLAGFASEQPVRELSTLARPFGNSPIPLFRHGYVVTFPPGAANGSPESSIKYGFSAYAPDGSFAFTKNIEVPNGTQPVVRDVDFDAEGNAVVAATARGGPSGSLFGILLLDRNGRQTGFIDTGHYSPGHIAIAPDRSMWTLGWQMDPGHPPYPERQDYMIVRHLSADGKEMKACPPRSSFPAGLEPGFPGPEVHIEVTQDRVGVLAYSGQTGGNAEWIELDLNGNLISRTRADNLTGPVVAFTADDHVYLNDRKGRQLNTLDAASHMWKPVQKQGAFFMGADGNYLVYMPSYRGPLQLQWFNQPQ